MANEKRLRANGVAGALSADLDTAATTMNSAGLADLPVVDGTNHAAITLFAVDGNGRITAKEVVYVTAHTASATSATVVRGQEGTTDQDWVSGDTWEHAPTVRDQAAGRVAFARRTAGNLTISSTSWASPDTGLDLVLAAQAGDIIEVSAAFISPTATPGIGVDAASIVSAAVVRTWSTDGAESGTSEGVTAWRPIANATGAFGGSCMRRIQSDEISAGTITIRFRARLLAAGSRAINASSTQQLLFHAVNHGPQQA